MTVSSPAFVFRGTKERWQLTIDGARSLRDRLGPALLASFLKCFLGLERLTSLVDLLLVAQQALPADGVRHRRNTRLLAFLLQSTLVEIAEALDGLNKNRVVFAMADPSTWAPLEAKRKLWLNDTRLRLVRNGVGHHLGAAADFQEGLDALLRDSDTLIFAVGEGERRIDDEQRLAWDALLRGLGHGARQKMDLADHKHVVTISQQGASEFAVELWSVWTSVLDHAGVSYLREESLLPR